MDDQNDLPYPFFVGVDVPKLRHKLSATPTVDESVNKRYAAASAVVH